MANIFLSVNFNDYIYNIYIYWYPSSPYIYIYTGTEKTPELHNWDDINPAAGCDSTKVSLILAWCGGLGLTLRDVIYTYQFLGAELMEFLMELTTPVPHSPPIKVT